MYINFLLLSGFAAFIWKKIMKFLNLMLTIWQNFFTKFLFLFRYRCSGTLVACQFAASGCDYRGPTKSMSKHQTECRFKKEGKKEFFFLSWTKLAKDVLVFKYAWSTNTKSLKNKEKSWRKCRDLSGVEYLIRHYL